MNSNKKPWPTKAAMDQVYQMKLWGSNNTPFYSGDGSHKTALVEPYLEVVKAFLTSFEAPITVCDLGCGDFNIGKQLVEFTKQYIAVDIVDDLILHNQKIYVNEKLQFLCLDIAKETLPKADCVILRQVLQHLSNAEIMAIVDKLQHFKYILLTEHIPAGEFEPNKDIISGQGIRLKKQSGVVLTSNPFNLCVKEEKMLLKVGSAEEFKGCIVTTLYTL